MQYTNATFDEIRRIQSELGAVAEREGLAPVELTGKFRLDGDAELCWFEVEDEHHTTSWVTADAPGAAAPGETLVAAASWDEAENLGSQFAK